MIWWPLGALVVAEIGYPLSRHRAPLVMATVVLGFCCAVGHCVATRGPRVGAALVATTALGGLLVEIVGVHTGIPFGRYVYGSALGPRAYGVPLVVPLAWTWQAWPAWLAAGALTRSRPARVAFGAVGLAGWDLFLDPQMVREGYWHWAQPRPALPGVPGVPLTNYLGWCAVAAGMMALLALLDDSRPVRRADAPMLALFLWTYGSAVLAHAVFLGLPASAAWGGALMGAVVLPLAVRPARGPWRRP